VTTGLQRIADNPDLREVHRAPVSMYLKSGDEAVVRVYRKGQSMSGKDLEQGDHHPQHFIVFNLVTEAHGKPEINLSVYCDQDSDAPSEVQTKRSKPTRKRKRSEDDAPFLVHKSLDNKTKLGHYTKDLCIKDPVPGKVYTAYVCVKVDRFGAKLFAVHTESGGKIPTLEATTVDAVIHNGQLNRSFEEVGKGLCLVDVAQVVRSETFGESDLGGFRHDSASVGTTNRLTQDPDSVLVPQSPPQGTVNVSTSLLPPNIESGLEDGPTRTGTTECPITVPESPGSSGDDQ
jgi:hypothetical protein